MNDPRHQADLCELNLGDAPPPPANPLPERTARKTFNERLAEWGRATREIIDGMEKEESERAKTRLPYADE